MVDSRVLGVSFFVEVHMPMLVIGGPGYKMPKESKKEDKSESSDDGGMDAMEAKKEAYDAFTRAVKEGDKESGMEALEAFVAACSGENY